VISTIPLAANYTFGISFDAAGDVFVATYANRKILKYDPDTGAQSVFFQLPVGSFWPRGLAFDEQGYLYVVDSAPAGRVLKVSPTGTSYTTVATGLFQPSSLVLDADGNVLVIDGGNSIRKIRPDGTASTIVTGFTGVRGLALADPPPDNPPVANAGVDQAIRANQTVYLDGTRSYDDNTPTQQLQYQWSFSSLPQGSTATITNADTATPSFFVDVADSYSVQLVVHDSAGQPSQPDYVEISTSNLAPTARAGADQLVVVGYPVALSGSDSSDPERDALAYVWQLSTPAGSAALLSGAQSIAPIFTPDVAGEYVATLSVSDALGGGAPDSVTITAAQPTVYAEVQIADAAETIATLTVDAVTTVGNQQSLTQLLSQAVRGNQAGNDLANQVRKLEDALSRTDGCALRGSPDVTGAGRDWINDCTAQASVYGSLKAALDALLASP
jgi:hypothetical protein